MTNRFDKVVFIIPPFEGQNQDNRGLLLGIGYVSQYLLDNGIANKVIDLRLGYDIPELKKQLADYAPGLVAFVVFTNGHGKTYKIVNAIKSKKYKILLGGYHASTIKTKILEETPADFAIKVEGEDAMLELCKGAPYESILNLMWRDGKKLVENPLRPYVTDLDRFNFPKYESFEFEKYDHVMPVCSSRGCPFFCTFCTTAVTAGRPFRTRTPENVLKEIKYWYDKGFRDFAFVDDNFTLMKDRVIELCKLIEKNKLTGLAMRCAGIRADRVDREVLTYMRKVGFTQLGLGVEVGNDKMLKIIKKGETMAAIEKAIREILRLKFDLQLYFVLGNQYETAQDIEDSFKLALKYPISDVHFYNPLPFPGSELFDWVASNNYFIEEFNNYINNNCNFSVKPVFETPELPAKERERLLRKSKVIEDIILRRYIARKMKPTFGLFASPLAFIVMLKPVKWMINTTFRHPVGKAAIRLFMKVFRVDVHYL
ncbi:radical SAM protein [Candidatus Woesearchaeota archaeon]|nr:radical SAM protein [Candidatus Woesearchaeota archaeon]